LKEINSTAALFKNQELNRRSGMVVAGTQGKNWTKHLWIPAKNVPG
jgi:type IV secretory pathway VirD2 relaxase